MSHSHLDVICFSILVFTVLTVPRVLPLLTDAMTTSPHVVGLSLLSALLVSVVLLIRFLRRSGKAK